MPILVISTGNRFTARLTLKLHLVCACPLDHQSLSSPCALSFCLVLSGIARSDGFDQPASRTLMVAGLLTPCWRPVVDDFLG